MAHAYQIHKTQYTRAPPARTKKNPTLNYSTGHISGLLSFILLMNSLFGSDFSVYVIPVKYKLKVSYRHYACNYSETTFQVQSVDF